MHHKIRASLFMSALGLAMLGLPVQSRAQEQQPPEVVCAQYSGLSGTYTQGQLEGGGPLPTGAVITVNATLGTATAATFEILNAVGGLNVVAGPVAAPGRLTHTVTSAESAIGIGFTIPTADGTVNIAASCSLPAATAPALSPFGLFACGLLLLGLGGAVARRQPQSSR